MTPATEQAIPENVFDTASNIDQVPQEPFVDEEAAVLSPFLATLGSILLDADYAHQDSEAVRTHAAAIEPVRSLEDVQFSPSLHVDYQIQLTGAEIPVFRNYVENVSRWAST